jgi:hypothetical protein
MPLKMVLHELVTTTDPLMMDACAGGGSAPKYGFRRTGTDNPGRHRLESQPSSRTGEKPAERIVGRIEQPSASFESRSAP